MGKKQDSSLSVRNAAAQKRLSGKKATLPPMAGADIPISIPQQLMPQFLAFSQFMATQQQLLEAQKEHLVDLEQQLAALTARRRASEQTMVYQTAACAEMAKVLQKVLAKVDDPGGCRVYPSASWAQASMLGMVTCSCSG